MRRWKKVSSFVFSKTTFPKLCVTKLLWLSGVGVAPVLPVWPSRWCRQCWWAAGRCWTLWPDWKTPTRTVRRRWVRQLRCRSGNEQTVSTNGNPSQPPSGCIGKLQPPLTCCDSASDRIRMALDLASAFAKMAWASPRVESNSFIIVIQVQIQRYSFVHSVYQFKINYYNVPSSALYCCGDCMNFPNLKLLEKFSSN